MDNQNRWYTIVNPIAGRGRGLEHWPQINALLRGAGVLFDAHFTDRKFHAIEMAFDAVRRGYRQIMIVGGDGTLHEAVCGLMMQEGGEGGGGVKRGGEGGKNEGVKSTDVLLAVFAVGTGNDWMRMFGLPKTYADTVRSIQQGHTFLQDVGKVTYFESRIPQTRYLCNVGGVAYDAAVCRSVNRQKAKGRKGVWLYLRSAFLQAIYYKSKRARIKCDGVEVFDKRLFTATIGIGKYTGGGLSQTPYAVPDDGLFDITIIPQMNRLKLFTRFGTLYTGNIYNINGVSLNRAKHIEIQSDGEIELELDGEILGVSDFVFEMIPKAIKVIVSDKFLLEFN